MGSASEFTRVAATEREPRAAPPRAEPGRNALGTPDNDEEPGMDPVEVVLAMLLAVVASAFFGARCFVSLATALNADRAWRCKSGLIEQMQIERTARFKTSKPFVTAIEPARQIGENVP